MEQRPSRTIEAAMTTITGNQSGGFTVSVSASGAQNTLTYSGTATDDTGAPGSKTAVVDVSDDQGNTASHSVTLSGYGDSGSFSGSFLYNFDADQSVSVTASTDTDSASSSTTVSGSGTDDGGSGGDDGGSGGDDGGDSGGTDDGGSGGDDGGGGGGGGDDGGGDGGGTTDESVLSIALRDVQTSPGTLTVSYDAKNTITSGSGVSADVKAVLVVDGQQSSAGESFTLQPGENRNNRQFTADGITETGDHEICLALTGDVEEPLSGGCQTVTLEPVDGGDDGGDDGGGTGDGDGPTFPVTIETKTSPGRIEYAGKVTDNTGASGGKTAIVAVADSAGNTEEHAVDLSGYGDSATFSGEFQYGAAVTVDISAATDGGGEAVRTVDVPAPGDDGGGTGDVGGLSRRQIAAGVSVLGLGAYAYTQR